MQAELALSDIAGVAGWPGWGLVTLRSWQPAQFSMQASPQDAVYISVIGSVLQVKPLPYRLLAFTNKYDTDHPLGISATLPFTFPATRNRKFCADNVTFSYIWPGQGHPPSSGTITPTGKACVTYTHGTDDR